MPKTLELHFNPKKSRKSIVFDSFCFVPEKKSEKDLGSLYLIGELNNVLPKNRKLIATLAKLIQKEYYSLPEKGAYKCFNIGLQSANEFLDSQIKNNNTDWLGKIKFAALSLPPGDAINFSKLDNLNTVLLRGKQAFNLGEGTASAMKVFSNVVTGKLSEGDKILAATSDLFDVFNQQGIIQDLALIEKPKEHKSIIKAKKKVLKKTSGACLLIFKEKSKSKVKTKKAKAEKVKKAKAKKIKVKGEKGASQRKSIEILTKVPKAAISKVSSRVSKPKAKVNNLLEKASQKAAPDSPLLQQKLKKSFLSIFILLIILLIGYLLF